MENIGKMKKGNKGKKVCGMCNEEFEGYGNNPRPIKKNGRCCDKCNVIVIIQRMKKLNKYLKKI